MDIRMLIKHRAHALGLSLQEAGDCTLGSRNSLVTVLNQGRKVTSKSFLAIMRGLRIRGQQEVRQWLAAFLVEDLGETAAADLLARAKWEFPETEVAAELLTAKQIADRNKNRIRDHLAKLPDGVWVLVSDLATALQLEHSQVDWALAALLEARIVKKKSKSRPGLWSIDRSRINVEGT